MLAAWTDKTERERGRGERECVGVRGAYIGDVNRQWSILGLRVTGLIRARAPVSLLASAILRLSVSVSNPKGKILFYILDLMLIFESLNYLRCEVGWEHFWFWPRVWRSTFCCVSALSFCLCLSARVYLCAWLHACVCSSICVCVTEVQQHLTHPPTSTSTTPGCLSWELEADRERR